MRTFSKYDKQKLLDTTKQNLTINKIYNKSLRKT